MIVTKYDTCDYNDIFYLYATNLTVDLFLSVFF